MLARSKHWAGFSFRGQRSQQDDRFVPQEDWRGPGTLLGVVADGHGADGDRVAEYASRRLPVLLRVPKYDTDPLGTVTEAFRTIDQEIKRTWRGGTTLVMVDLSPDRMVVAHVGDAAASLVSTRRVVELTCDHHSSAGRLTRALGNRGADHVLPDPDVRVISHHLGCRWVLMGSDELWRALNDRLIQSSVLAGLLDKPTILEARNALQALLEDDHQTENVTALLLDVSLLNAFRGSTA